MSVVWPVLLLWVCACLYPSYGALVISRDSTTTKVTLHSTMTNPELLFPPLTPFYSSDCGQFLPVCRLMLHGVLVVTVVSIYQCVDWCCMVYSTTVCITIFVGPNSFAIIEITYLRMKCFCLEPLGSALKAKPRSNAILTPFLTSFAAVFQDSDDGGARILKVRWLLSIDRKLKTNILLSFQFSFSSVSVLFYQKTSVLLIRRPGFYWSEDQYCIDQTTSVLLMRRPVCYWSLLAWPQQI